MPFINKEDERAYRKEYYRLNKEKIKNRANEYYYNNIEHTKEVHEKYKKTEKGMKSIDVGRSNEKIERIKSVDKAIDEKNYYKRWCSQEDSLLIQLKENKASWKYISEKLSRSIKGAEKRYEKLTKELI